MTLTRADAHKLAREHLKDARALLRSGRPDGAVYLAGYVVELALKARICRTLKWTEYQMGDAYRSFKTHDLDVLLSLTGVGQRIKTMFLAEWSTVQQWKPDMRYASAGTTLLGATIMVDAAATLMRAL